ncbi:MAP kinase-activated protein kinase 2 [Schistosoma haematobium]|uniref:non-specific serine/threonine protein kinase n=1 Tax=Schistosoma haematobium TaxID=6185 RepID=A0A922IMS6_SCHHA|nr:MAP kinase-activated protein kinase 2 [Schistosoma haematobium]KAH9583078.1 MAP kinase-activated protein kinase 2 [Schistosoma haematobium]
MHNGSTFQKVVAKDLIKSLLLTEPDRRPTIREVMNNHWVAQYNDVPNTPLGTSMFFTTKAWDQFREMFRESLQTKRKEHSNVPTLMTLDASKNPLLIKRKINQKSNPENNSHKVL